MKIEDNRNQNADGTALCHVLPGDPVMIERELYTVVMDGGKRRVLCLSTNTLVATGADSHTACRRVNARIVIDPPEKKG